MSLSVKCTARRKGEASDALGLFASAWEEFPELKRRTLKQFLADSMAYIDDDRWELLVYDGEVAIGGCICLRNLDPHVGQSLLILYQYIAPAYRGVAICKALMRACKVLCWEQGLSTLVFTHRVSKREYRITYYGVRDGIRR